MTHADAPRGAAVAFILKNSTEGEATASVWLAESEDGRGVEWFSLLHYRSDKVRSLELWSHFRHPGQIII